MNGKIKFSGWLIRFAILLNKLGRLTWFILFFISVIFLELDLIIKRFAVTSLIIVPTTTFILKLIINKRRPRCDNLTDFENNSSFPSGHTTYVSYIFFFSLGIFLTLKRDIFYLISAIVSFNLLFLIGVVRILVLKRHRLIEVLGSIIISLFYYILISSIL